MTTIQKFREMADAGGAGGAGGATGRTAEHPTPPTAAASGHKARQSPAERTTTHPLPAAAAASGPGARPSPTERTTAHPTLSEAANVFVLVDEAHRTQYRSLAANMRRALPNACFLGFTGTPIDKQDRSTLRTFGPYIDTYTIEEAVRDGATVPIFYESRLPELRIIGQTIDQVFDRVFADRSDEERAAIRQRYATEQAVAGAPRRIEAICLDLIDHFTRFIAPNRFKAQVVAASRHDAATYKETLDRLNAPESAVVMSAGHNDEERLARWRLGREQQDRLIGRFRDRDDPLSILVVCDMLLTGFDAPVEQVMYLDAPLREHGLPPGRPRVNRPWGAPCGAEKTYGLVVDYRGVSTRLQEALAVFSTTEVQGALTPNVDELPRLQSRHAAAMRFFPPPVAGRPVAERPATDRPGAATEDLDACVRMLEAEDVRAGFDLAFRRFSRSMDMLLPDPRALAYRGDLQWLGKIRGAARAPGRLSRSIPAKAGKGRKGCRALPPGPRRPARGTLSRRGPGGSARQHPDAGHDTRERQSWSASCWWRCVRWPSLARWSRTRSRIGLRGARQRRSRPSCRPYGMRITIKARRRSSCGVFGTGRPSRTTRTRCARQSVAR